MSATSGSDSTDGAAQQSESSSDDYDVDITSMVEACAATLTASHPFLCDDKTFTLLDGISALEIMDSKMDCCQIPASATPLATASVASSQDDVMIPPRPLPTGLDDQVHPLPWNNLSTRDAENIALETLTRLESMLSGTSVAESAFTCLYAHKAVLADMKSRLRAQDSAGTSLTDAFTSLLEISAPKERSSSLAQHAVYATTLALMDVCELVRSIVVHADIYEEEDFSTSTFGLEFVSKESDKEVIDTVTQVIGLTESVHDDDGSARIIRLVLQFELDMLTACAAMASLVPERARKITEETKSVVASGLRHLGELKSILETREKVCVDTDPVLKRSFDAFLYRPLVGSTPVRKVSFHKPVESIEILRTVVAEIDWAVCDLLLHGTSLGRIRRMLERISSSSVNILARSLMMLNLYFGERLLGQYALANLIADDLKQLSGMPDVALEGKFANAFLNRLVRPMYDTLKLRILHRSRQNAYMEAIMLQDWASLQQEARSVDLTMWEGPPATGESFAFFSHYTLANAERLMEHHVALSVELTLVRGHHDLAIAYWYRDYLLAALHSTLTAMHRTKVAAKQSVQRHDDTPSNSRGKKKGGAKKQLTASTPSPEDVLDDFDMALVFIKRNLCKGISRYFAALNQANLLRSPDYEFTSHEIRFQQRFEPFALIMTPPPLSYDDFRHGSDFSSIPQSDLLSATADCFKASKRSVDELLSFLPDIDTMCLPMGEEGLRSLAKVCVGNSVFLMKLAQLVNAGQEASGSVAVDLETNKQFCTIKIS